MNRAQWHAVGFFSQVLGLIHSQTGAYTLGFVFLSAFALLCLAANYLVFLRERSDREAVPAN